MSALPSPTLSLLIDDTLDQLLSPVHDLVCAMEGNALVRALRDGTLKGIEPDRAKLAAALHAAGTGEWLRGLGLLREALFYGAEPALVRSVQGLFILGMQEALPVDTDLREELFTVEALGQLRALEVELSHPGLPIAGPETQIVEVERRPLAELQMVFLGLLGPDTTEKHAMARTAEEAAATIEAPRASAQELASAHAKLAALACAAGDFREACHHVVRGYRLAQDSRELLVVGGFTWVCLFAAAREGLLTEPACLPTATNLLGTLQGALANEAAPSAAMTMSSEALR